MIFTTKNKELAIFGNTLTETKGKLIEFFEAFERGGIKGQDGIIGTFFSKNKKSPLTPELLETFELFKDKFNSTFLSAEALAEQFGEVDQRIIDYAKTCKNGEMTTKGFKASISSMTLSAKAGTAALKALTIGLNMAIMYGATKLIGSFVNFIDNLHTTLKEQQEITQNLQGELSEIQSDISDVNSELQTTSDRIDELSKKDSLSFVEKEELENLTAQNEELERRNRLLKEQEAAKQQEVAESVQREFNKEYGNRTYTRVATQQQMEDIEKKKSRQYELYINIGANTAEEAAELEQLDKELAAWNSSMYSSSTFSDHIQETIAAYESLNQRIKEGEILTERETNQLADYRKELVDYNVDLEDYISRYGIDDEISQSWKDLSNSIYECLYPAEYLTEKFNETFNGLSENVQTELKELARDGSLSVEDLSEDMINKFSEAGFSASEVIEQLLSEYEELSDSASQIPSNSPLSITETIDQLNTRLRPALESLGAAYRNIFTEDGFTPGNVDISILDSIRSAMEDLNSMEDVTIHIDYDSFDELARVLTDPASLEGDVHDAINRLATDIVGSMTPAISECSEENYRLMQTLLESMGIANAEALLISELGYSYEEYENAKKAAERAGISLNDAVAETCLSLLQEKEISEEDAQTLIDYYIQKALASGTTIYTLDTVNELINEYEQLGLNCDKLREYRDLLRRSNTDEHGHYEGGSTYGLGAGNYEPVGYTPKAPQEAVEVEYAADEESKTGFSSSEQGASKSTPAPFDWVTTAIDHVEKEIKALDEVANSAYSTFSQKNEALAHEISKVSEEIDLQQQAYTNYRNRAEAVGLSDHYKNLIQNGSLGMEDITDETLQDQISEYQKWYDKAQETQDKINDLHQKSNDLHITSYENCVKELETLRDSQAISEREYLDRMNVLWEKYYANQIEYAVQAKEAKLKLLDAEKDYLESVANAAADILGEQSDELKNRQESEIELLEAKKKPLEDQLELLEEQKDKEDRILTLQKAQYELKRAESQRSKLTYIDGQMQYRADETNIRDAKNAVNDAEYNIIKADIQDRINAYDKEIAKINERYEAEIANIERLENEWQNALALQERAQNSVNFESMFGEGSIAKLLAGDLSMVNTWKQTYLHTLGAIDMVSIGSIGEITTGYAELAGLDLSNIVEQTSAVASQFSSTNNAVNRLSASLGFEPANGTADATSPAQAQTEGNSRSLAGALQNTYDIATEVLPEEAKMMNAITEATNTAIAAINELKSAIESLSTVSTNVSGMSIYGNAYASGTRRAEKGLALVGEEKPEVILTNDKKAFLAKQPTLLNMEGGETVFDGNATAKMLEAKGFRPITADEFPLLKAFSSYSPDELRQKFAPNLTSPAKSAASSAMQNANHAVNNSSVNNGPSYTTGDVHIHCPGITKDEVAKQIGTELTNVFSGLSLKAYQRANITR